MTKVNWINKINKGKINSIAGKSAKRYLENN